MPSDQQEMAQGFQLAAVAVVSAVITATVVIGAGQIWLARSAHAAVVVPIEGARLLRTTG